MTSFCSPAVDDLIFEGVTGVLRVIPGGEDAETRQTYEGIVHTVTGMYDSYRALELLLDQETGVDGDIGNNTNIVMRAFKLSWSFVDSAYGFQSVSRTKQGRKLIVLPDEIEQDFKAISEFRNYMNHLPGNFRNAASAKDFAPLFGWLSYQVTPFFKDAAAGIYSFFVPLISSSHLKGSYTINMRSHSSETVFGFIDYISLHIKKDLHFNISRFMQNLTLVMNEWHIEHIGRLTRKCEIDGNGLSSPFIRIVNKADLPRDHPINRHTFDSELLKNKMRVEVLFDN